MQAHLIIDQLKLLETANFYGAFVFTFVFPRGPYNDDPSLTLTGKVLAW